MTASKEVRNGCVFTFGLGWTSGKLFGVLARAANTSQRVRTNGKPLESALLGSLSIVHGESLACQERNRSEVDDNEA